MTSINQHKLGVRMIDDVLALLCGACRVEATADATRTNRAQIANGPFRDIAHQHTHGSTVRQPVRQQSAAEGVRFAVEVIPGDSFPVPALPNIEDLAPSKMCDALTK